MNTPYDLLVVGGGIQGAAIARDAGTPGAHALAHGDALRWRGAVDDAGTGGPSRMALLAERHAVLRARHARRAR